MRCNTDWALARRRCRNRPASSLLCRFIRIRLFPVEHPRLGDPACRRQPINALHAAHCVTKGVDVNAVWSGFSQHVQNVALRGTKAAVRTWCAPNLATGRRAHVGPGGLSEMAVGVIT